jgi:dihydrofolate synthase/folylpolyglutamate synthase
MANPPPGLDERTNARTDGRTMQYDDALAYLLAPTDPSRPVVARPDANLNLPRMRRLLDLLGAPDTTYDAVVIAGTKGKGSTSAMLDSLARAAGKRVGLYTQPHLHDYRERVRVDGVPIGREELVAAVERMRPAVEAVAAAGDLGAPSTYDLGTVLALVHFATANVDLAVLEVGLGGRFDSVNTVVPRVSAITSISIDHTAVLGNTIEQIAGEKAGIIKPGVPVVAQPQVPAAWEVLAATAAAQGASLHRADTLVRVTPGAIQPDSLTGRQALDIAIAPDRAARLGLPATIAAVLPLLGAYQRANVATALGVAMLLAEQGRLALTPGNIARGLAATHWPGRLEIVRRSPLTVVDGAHNADSAEQLRRAIAENFPGRPVTLVLGTSLDKDIPGIARALAPAAARTILTVSSHPRSASLDQLRAALPDSLAHVEADADIRAALDRAISVTPSDGVICVTGSLFLVADAREALGVG